VVTGDCRTDPWRQSPGRRLRICSLTAAQRDGERSDEPVGHSRCKHRPARGRHLDRRDELARAGVVEQHAARSGEKPRVDAIVSFGRGQQHHRGAGLVA
jgi:hypothetical protein